MRWIVKLFHVLLILAGVLIAALMITGKLTERIAQ